MIGRAAAAQQGKMTKSRRRIVLPWTRFGFQLGPSKRKFATGEMGGAQFACGDQGCECLSAHG
jgi:hypothetical protein